LTGPAGNIEYLLWLETIDSSLVAAPSLEEIRSIAEAARAELVN
jgi:hypothetical protein